MLETYHQVTTRTLVWMKSTLQSLGMYFVPPQDLGLALGQYAGLQFSALVVKDG
jgi:hypothetical protein